MRSLIGTWVVTRGGSFVASSWVGCVPLHVGPDREEGHLRERVQQETKLDLTRVFGDVSCDGSGRNA